MENSQAENNLEPASVPSARVDLRAFPKAPPRVNITSESAIERALRMLQAGCSSPVLRGQLVLQALHELLLEVGASRGDVLGLLELLHSLWPSPSKLGALADLFIRAQQSARGIDRHSLSNDLQVREQLEFAVHWLRRRQNMLQRFFDEKKIGLNLAHEKNQFLTAILNFPVQRLGVEGTELYVSALFLGLAGRPVYLQLRVWRSFGLPEQREAVRCAPGCEPWTWTEQRCLADAAGPVLLEQVLIPESQRNVVDELLFFLPHAALALAPGMHPLELELTMHVFEVGSGQRLVLARKRVLQNLHISSQHYTQSRHSSSLPPALGLAKVSANDCISGDSIENHRAVCSSDVRGQSILQIICDINLCAHQGEECYVESRLLQEDGYFAELQPGKERINPQRAIRLVPGEMFSCHRAVHFELPLAFVATEPAPKVLYSEVSLLGSRRRLLCRSLAMVRVVEQALRHSAAN